MSDFSLLPRTRVHFRHARQDAGLGLGVAPDGDDGGVGVSPPRLPDGLPAAVVRLAGDGAGVDDVDRGALPEGEDAVPPAGELSLQVERFELVELAPQGEEGHGQVLLHYEITSLKYRS